ncbi:hypothetical protein [Haloplanus salilacus]|uniref:DUF7847 domain-containing protein n=1 Tax=Haloplanus salilacus TaxID=2949994 RepID=UPI0030D0CFDE
MTATGSLRTAVDALSRNPVVVLGALVYALVLLPQRALQLAGVPIVPALLQLLTFFVTPFVVAGVVGMAQSALDGESSLADLTAVGKDRYVDLLLATILEVGIQLTFGIVFLIAAVLAMVVGSAGGGPVFFVGVAVVVLLMLVYVAVLFLIQFYPVAVVVDEAGPVGGITESVSFVRNNLLSTLGYSAITFVLGSLAALPITGFVGYQTLTSDSEPVGGGEPSSEPNPFGGGMGPGGNESAAPPLGDLFAGGMELGLSTPEIVAISLVSVATTALFFAFRHTYATAFYRRHGRSVEERVLGADDLE